MVDADTVIQARFLILIAHICVGTTLLWDIESTVQACLSEEDPESLSMTYYTRTFTGLCGSIALSFAELLTFLLGLTMFSTATSLFSTLAHFLGCFSLYDSIVNCHFDWAWTVLVSCNVLPAAVDILNSFRALAKKF